MKPGVLLVAMILSCTVQAQVPTLPPVKYDIDLELDHFIVSNVRDLDGTEDLYGSLFLKTLGVSGQALLTTTADPPTTWRLWVKPASAANNNNYRNGTYPVNSWFRDINNGAPLYKNLTLNQLKHLEVRIGGVIFDKDIFDINYKCASCSYSQWENGVGYRIIKFAEMPATLTSISNLLVNGSYQVLKGDTDIYFEMRFWEDGIKENGYLRTMWKVWIKPHY